MKPILLRTWQVRGHFAAEPMFPRDWKSPLSLPGNGTASGCPGPHRLLGRAGYGARRALSVRHRPVNVLKNFLKPEIRYARRMARIAQWDRELVRAARPRASLDEHAVRRPRHLPAPLSEPWPRLGRAVALRRSRARARSPGSPAPGGKTIVNLRGGREHGSWPLERDACRRHHITLADFMLRSREAPDKATISAWRPSSRRSSIPCSSIASRARTGPASSRRCS